MKISDVKPNRRSREFSVRAGGRTYLFPYVKLRLQPTQENPVARVYPDPELGCEAFTYALASGEEDTIHMDAVREVNLDPEYLEELLLHRLATAAERGLAESGLGKRQVARILGTSPAQIYRLFDRNSPSKSLGQLLTLLRLANKSVDVTITDSAEPPVSL